MGTSSEDVLLMVGQVRHKKNDGTLYLMAERVGWIMGDKESFTISIKYSDIKMQKISPEGKPKVQLQVVLHSGESTTFHFANAMGSESQVSDRNGVKELLQQLLPKFKKKMNKELEEKNKILAEDPVRFQLYRDLVMSQVITSEEFWADYGKPNQKASSNHVQQDVGVSAAFLCNINPQSDGTNGIKYIVPTDVVEQIFKTYPIVKRKHMENVPDKISENEFWTKFFQSHYFHRDRLNFGGKDLFSECAKNDEQDLQLAIKEKVLDSFLDINSFDDNVVEEISRYHSNTETKNNQANNNQSVILKRFNHHSIMVLESCASKKSELLAQSKTQMSLAKPNGVILPKNCVKTNGPTSNHCDEPNPKRSRLEERTEYEDLQADHNKVTVNLNLKNSDRYFHGPIPLAEVEKISSEDIESCYDLVSSSIENWTPSALEIIAPSAASAALAELCPGGALMRNSDGTLLKDSVPVEIQTELKLMYNALAELLRHFWSCFPTSTPQLEEKLLKMQTTLQRFQYAKIEPFQEKLSRLHVPSDLADHLMSLLEAAYNKFSSWQIRMNKSMKI